MRIRAARDREGQAVDCPPFCLSSGLFVCHSVEQRRNLRLLLLVLFANPRNCHPERSLLQPFARDAVEGPAVVLAVAAVKQNREAEVNEGRIAQPESLGEDRILWATIYLYKNE